MSVLPVGTVTFLFTDIEGSTRRWEHQPDAMRAALARHDALLREAIEGRGGYVFKTVGDAFCAAFASPHSALGAALDAQNAIRIEQWEPEIGDLRVRVALHTGVADLQDGDYFGQPLNRVARLLSAGHGGQTLLSLATQELVRDSLPKRLGLLDLGQHRLKDLIRPEHVFQVVAPDLPQEFPLLKTLDNRPNNLPRQTTALIGREKEVSDVCALLRRDEVALVTLTGPGGTGKTRLALQAGADLLDDFPNGVWFVELAALTDPNLVASTIAQTFGLTESEGRPLIESLKDYLREKQILLVLDNFEQVAEAAPVIDTLLKAAPRLKVLVTSRLALHLYGQKEYPVPPLGLPPMEAIQGARQAAPLRAEQYSQYEAVRLFIERAQDVKPDFQVTNDNAPAVAEICARLDGLPLAIELAAARVRLFPPQALLARLGSRLKMLTGGGANMPARQQTLRNAIEWSYDLLDEGDKQLFRRMAIFQGGRTLEALEAVCNADGSLQTGVLEGVQSLVEKSLLQQREGQNGEPRFWMLETIHEYVREKLEESGEAEEFKRQHAAYFLALAEEAEPLLFGPNQLEWLDRLDEEHDNLRAALDWALERDTQVALRLAAALRGFWPRRGHHIEARAKTSQVLSRADVEGVGPLVALAKALNSAGALNQDPALERAFYERSLVTSRQVEGSDGKRLVAQALSSLGALANSEHDYSLARTLYEESLALAQQIGYKFGAAVALRGLGNGAFWQGDFERARSYWEQALEIHKQLENKSGIASITLFLARLAEQRSDYAQADALWRESLAIHRYLKNRAGEATALSDLAVLAGRQGDWASAGTFNEESLAIYRDLGIRSNIANGLVNIAPAFYHEGDYAAAQSRYQESLAVFRELGDRKGIAECLEGFGVLAGASGQLERATRLFGAMQALFDAIGVFLDLADPDEYERMVETARAALGDEAFEAVWAEGQAMEIEQAIAYALEEG